jgi:hypothetical protein
MTPIMKILVENAMTYNDRNKIYSLMEAEVNNVNNTMIANLYKSAIEKSHVDFEDIPQSKGDITKYSGYKSMMDSLTLLKEIMGKSAVRVDDVQIVETAISNITAYREQFEKGFKLEKDFILLQYNVLVSACVESVSLIISSYLDFIKRPDRIEFNIINNNKQIGSLCLQNLNEFNYSVKSGEFPKVINAVINSGKESFIGVDDLVIPAVIIGGVALLVPIIRELIFYFYYSRMKLSDYLELQASFLELNKNNIESSSLAANKKNSILKKQEDLIKKLYAIADKIKVNHIMTQNKSIDEMNKQNKGWTIGEIQNQAASTDKTGFKLL